MIQTTIRRLAAALCGCLLVIGCGASGPAPTGQAASPTPSPSPSPTLPSPSPSPSPDSSTSTEGWVALSSPTGAFSFLHPADWNFDNCPGGNSGAAHAIQVTANGGQSCGSESGFYSLLVMSILGDHRSEVGHNYVYIGTVQSTKDVTRDGVTGTRSEALIPKDPGMGPEGGTTQVLYLFFTGGNTYLVLYQHRPIYSDATATFDLLVASTFKFSA